MVEPIYYVCQTRTPDDMTNETPAWMCITREGDEKKLRRDRKNMRLARIMETRLERKRLREAAQLTLFQQAIGE